MNGKIIVLCFATVLVGQSISFPLFNGGELKKNGDQFLHFDSSIANYLNRLVGGPLNNDDATKTFVTNSVTDLKNEGAKLKESVGENLKPMMAEKTDEVEKAIKKQLFESKFGIPVNKDELKKISDAILKSTKDHESMSSPVFNGEELKKIGDQFSHFALSVTNHLNQLVEGSSNNEDASKRVTDLENEAAKLKESIRKNLNPMIAEKIDEVEKEIKKQVFENKVAVPINKDELKKMSDSIHKSIKDYESMSSSTKTFSTKSVTDLKNEAPKLKETVGKNLKPMMAEKIDEVEKEIKKQLFENKIFVLVNKDYVKKISDTFLQNTDDYEALNHAIDEINKLLIEGNKK